MRTETYTGYSLRGTWSAMGSDLLRMPKLPHSETTILWASDVLKRKKYINEMRKKDKVRELI